MYFNASENVSPVLLHHCLVMVTDEELITCKCFKKGNLGGISL